MARLSHDQYSTDMVADRQYFRGHMLNILLRCCYLMVIYILCSQDSIFTGDVSPGNRNATSLTVTYICDYPGTYQLHVEEVWREPLDASVHA